MNKPDHLGRDIAEQFGDPSIVANYHYRPPYSDAAIQCLSRCLGKEQMSVLDIGCGTGEISIPLSIRGHRVTGVDPSFEIISVAKQKDTDVAFAHSFIEEFESNRTFDLFVAANSIHWPDWSKTFTKLKSLSKPHSKIAIVTGGDLIVESIQQKLLPLIQQYSTTQNFKAYNVIDMLTEQGYIKGVVTQTLPIEAFRQSVRDYVASFHARNGFSLDRMTDENAQQFDAELTSLLQEIGFQKTVQGSLQFSITLADISVPTL